MGHQSTTFEEEVQPANLLRHEGCAKFITSIKPKHLKIVSLNFENNLEIFFQSNISFIQAYNKIHRLFED